MVMGGVVTERKRYVDTNGLNNLTLQGVWASSE